MTRRTIAHIDMDAFYVSVELQQRPDLRGLPVVVSGTGPRAVVTTASYEARKFGVGSAIPASQARRLCPDAVFLPPDFAAYRARSAEVMEVLAQQVDVLEVVGLDEAYMDLSDFERPRAAGRRIKAAVTARTGLGCSIGIGPSKLVAKVASDADKPDGFLMLSAQEAHQRFAGHSPRLIPGIGPKTVKRLEEHGITRLDQLAGLGDDRLAAWFGERLGPHMRRLARFEDDRVLETDRVRKSESKETTFDRDLVGLEALEPVLERLANQLAEDLTAHGRSGRTVGIKLRLDDFSTHTRARTLPATVSDPESILTTARDLLRAFDPPRPVRLLGVRVAGMEGDHRSSMPADAAQLDLGV
ncbi:MAG: DNA polymerase IV [Thermoleophilaceae bacterium]